MLSDFRYQWLVVLCNSIWPQHVGPSHSLIGVYLFYTRNKQVPFIHHECVFAKFFFFEENPELLKPFGLGLGGCTKHLGCLLNPIILFWSEKFL
jgi:hypothetical protein